MLAVSGVLLSAELAHAADRQNEGTVYYKGGEPAASAAVQLEDQTTLLVISHLTDKDGRFRFLGLNSDKQYELRATKKGYWSKSRTLDRFSSRTTEKITLYLIPGSDKKK